MPEVVGNAPRGGIERELEGRQVFIRGSRRGVRVPRPSIDDLEVGRPTSGVDHAGTGDLEPRVRLTDGHHGGDVAEVVATLALVLGGGFGGDRAAQAHLPVDIVR